MTDGEQMSYTLRTALLMLVCLPVFAGPLDETRYCGEPKRDANGQIVRSAAVRAAFQRLHPCPSTGLSTGPCPGWQKDHIVSLGAKHPTLGGGCDSVSNMQWLPVGIKTCAASTGVPCKDRWELWVYSLESK